MIIVAILLVTQAPDRAQSVLLLGLDSRPESVVSRPDVIQVIRFDYQHQSISSIPLPRDLYIEHGIYRGRLNAVGKSLDARYPDESSFRVLREVASRLVNQPVPYFVSIDMAGFTEVVDSLGGIDIEVKCPFSESFIVRGSSSEQFEFPAKVVHLNGAQALAYARYRRTGGDLSRISHQQQILSALHRKLQLSSWSRRMVAAWTILMRVESNLPLHNKVTIFRLLINTMSKNMKGLSLWNRDVVDHLVVDTGQRVISIESNIFASTAAASALLSVLGDSEQPCSVESIRHGKNIVFKTTQVR